MAFDHVKTKTRKTDPKPGLWLQHRRQEDGSWRSYVTVTAEIDPELADGDRGWEAIKSTYTAGRETFKQAGYERVLHRRGMLEGRPRLRADEILPTCVEYECLVAEGSAHPRKTIATNLPGDDSANLRLVDRHLQAAGRRGFWESAGRRRAGGRLTDAGRARARELGLLDS